MTRSRHFLQDSMMRRFLLSLGALLTALAVPAAAQVEYDEIREDDPLQPIAVQRDGFHRWYGSASFVWSDSGASAGDVETDLSAALPGTTVNSAAFDESDVGFTVLGGYRIDETFSVELGFTDLGSIESELEFQNGVASEIESAIRNEHPVMGSGVTLGGRAVIVESETFDVSVKLGGFFWQSQNEFSITLDGNQQPTFTEDDSGVDLFYGVGLHYLFDDAWSAQLEWQNYQVEDEWVSFLSLGARYDFDWTSEAPPPMPN